MSRAFVSFERDLVLYKFFLIRTIAQAQARILDFRLHKDLVKLEFSDL